MSNFVPSPSPRIQYPAAVHFGAGSIGLGFIGVIIAKAGYHVVFADVNPRVIEHLNEDHTYTISYLEPRRKRPFRIQNISGVLSTDVDGIMELSEDIADTETKLITTSTGIGALKHIAPIIAKGIIRRKEEGSGSLNVIACENGKGASDVLKEAVYKELKDDIRHWADQHVGFANCSVDRIVPQPAHEKENLLVVGVDRFFEWIVDINALKSVAREGDAPTLSPPVPGMILTDNLLAYQTRKLHILNCGHAITAYLGLIFNHEVISSAIADKDNIFPIVEGAMRENGNALLKEYPKVFRQDEMDAYIQKTLGRFQNPEVVDDVKRVGRQPLRKLGANERFLGPFHLAKRFNIPTKNLAVGIAAALMFRNDEDEEALEMKKIQDSDGIVRAMEKILELKPGSSEFQEVTSAYKDLEDRKRAFAQRLKN